MTHLLSRLAASVLALMLVALPVAACGSSKASPKKASPAKKTTPTQSADGTVHLGKGKGTIKVGAGVAGVATTRSSGYTKYATGGASANGNPTVVPYVGIGGVELGMTRAQVASLWTPAASEKTQNSPDGGPPTTRLNYGARSVLIDTDTNKVILIDSTATSDYLANGLHAGATLVQTKTAEPQADCADATPGPGVCRLDNGSGAITDFIIVKGKVSRVSIGYFRD